MLPFVIPSLSPASACAKRLKWLAGIRRACWAWSARAGLAPAPTPIWSFSNPMEIYSERWCWEQPTSSDGTKGIRAATVSERPNKLMANPIPLAYLITFTCFGTRLHGDESGSVDRNHNVPGTPFLPPDKTRLLAEEQRMKHEPYV